MARRLLKLAMERLGALADRARTSLRFATGMAIMGGVFVLVQALLAVEGALLGDASTVDRTRLAG
jgi:hypothetical protein